MTQAANRIIDLRERGAEREGVVEALDRRMFMQLLAFECPDDSPSSSLESLGAALVQRGGQAVIYEDLNDPSGIAVLSFSEDPLDFATKLRPAVEGVRGLRLRREFTMLGRTYSTGFETDLAYWLLRRPLETVLNPDWPWAIWYPLRRSGAFERLEPRERGAILREHAEIGKAYGVQGLAHDVRLACHGLDVQDNEFVIGLVGPKLHPLSHVVQAMRGTRQTAEFISHMGPFFVGRAVFWNGGCG